MASYGFLLNNPDLNVPGRGDVSWGDYASTFKDVGGSDVAVALPATTRWIAEQGLDPESGIGRAVLDYSKYFQDKTRAYGEDSLADLSPAARARLTADILSPEFWEHPVSSTMLKLTRTAPTFALGAAAALIPGVNTAVAAGTVGSLLSVGQTLDEIHADYDRQTDQQLRQIPFYNDLRNQGVSERDARIQFDNAVIGAKPVLLAAIGGITGGFGPGAQVGRMVGRALGREGFEKGAETVERRLLSRVGREALQGGTAEAVQTGAEAISTEDARVAGGLQPDINWRNVASATAEGALLGAIPGGLTGIPRSRVERARSAPAHDTTQANERAHAHNPSATKTEDLTQDLTIGPPDSMQDLTIGPSRMEIDPTIPPFGRPTAVEVDPTGPIVSQTGPISMPGRANETQSSPAMVPQSGKHAPPLGASTDAPSRNRKKTRSQGAQGAVPTEPANENSIVLDEAQATAIAGLQPATSSPDAGMAPQAPTSPVGAVPTGPATPPPSVDYGEPMTYPRLPGNIEGRRVLDVLPGQREQETINARRAQEAARGARLPVEEVAPEPAEIPTSPQEAPPTLKGKDTTRNRKLLEDGQKVQAILDARPREVEALSISQFKEALQGIVDAAAKAGVKPRKRVGYATTPDALVWLAEVNGLLNKLNKNIKVDEKIDAINTFWEGEQALIRNGDSTILRRKRQQEGEAVGQRRISLPDVEALSTIGEEVETEQGAEAAPLSSMGPKRATTRPGLGLQTYTEQHDIPYQEGKAVTDAKTRQQVAQGEEDISKYSPSQTIKLIKEAAKKPKKLTKKAQKALAAQKKPPAKVLPEPKPKQESVDKRLTEAEVKAKFDAERKAVAEQEAARVKEAKAKEAADTETAIKELMAEKKITKRAATAIVKGHIKKRQVDEAAAAKRAAEEAERARTFVGPIKPEALTMLERTRKVRERERAEKEARSKERAEKRKPLRSRPRKGKYIASLPEKVKAETPAPQVAKKQGPKRKILTLPKVKSLGELGAALKRKAAISESILDEALTNEDVAMLATDVGMSPEVARSFQREAAESAEGSADTLRMVENNSVLSKTVRQAFETIRDNRQALGLPTTVWTKLHDRFAQRIARLAGNVKVHVVPDNVYATMSSKSNGFYNPFGNFIVLRESDTRDASRFSRLVMHEATHAAFVKATHTNPKLAAQLQKILQAADRAYQKSQTLEGHYTPDAKRPYGFLTPDEMLAELTSNGAFMEFMARTQADPDLIAEVGLNKKRRFTSWWDMTVRMIGRLLHVPIPEQSLLSSTLRVMENLELQAKGLNTQPMNVGASIRYIQQQARIGAGLTSELRLPEQVNQYVPQHLRSVEQALQTRAPRLLSLRSTDGLAQLAKQYGAKFGEVVRQVANHLEKIRVTAGVYMQKWLPYVLEARKLERKYKGTPQWQEYENVLHDERWLNVFANVKLEDQPHVGGKDALAWAYAHKHWPELNARWKALPDDLKAQRLRTLEFYASIQNGVNALRLGTVMRAAGFSDQNLIDRVFNNKETEADKNLMGRTYDHIKETEELSKVEGPYYPQMRRGDFVVRARFKVKPPNSFLRELPDDEGNVNAWEFSTKQEAINYAASQTDLYPNVSSVWVNKNTGERYYTDQDGVERRYNPSDTDAEQRFRVRVENRYMELFDKNTALEVQKELENNPNVESVKGAEPRQFQPDDRRADMSSYQIRVLSESLRKKQSFQDLSPREKSEVEDILTEVSLRLMPHTRVHTRSLPFKHIQGASRDSIQAMIDYAESMAGYMGRLHHQQGLNDAVRSMEAETGTDASKSLGRGGIRNEILQRVLDSSRNPTTGFWKGVTNRWLIASYLARLASPATNTINMLQPTTTTLPVLAGRFGMGKSARKMLQVYKQIHAGSVLKQGLTATGKAFKEDFKPPSFVEDIKLSLTPDQIRMIDELVELGSIDGDAGIEVNALYNMQEGLTGMTDRSLDSLQRFARQMPRAIEVMNRAVSAVAAYDLELEKTGDHAKATRFAQETVNMTQGIYSTTNAPRIFNHPLLRISLQFKMYAQLIYGLLAHQVGKAYRNAEPGDRAEALKTLGWMLGSISTMAGTLGLPTEPIKVPLMIAASLGLTDWGWEDVENWEREVAASLLGKEWGEVLTHGISRALPEGMAFDLSGRVGYQDLLIFGEPNANNEEAVKAYLWELFGGAPVELGASWAKGAYNIIGGDFVKGAEQLAPIKVAADLVKSYRIATEGKLSGAGYESLSPYSLGEAAIRTFGFTPAREAEAGEASRYFYGQQRKGQAARASYLHQWAQATPSERLKLWGQIERDNRSLPPDERITRADLDRYMRSRLTMEKSRVGGLRVTRREQTLLRDIQNVYNVSP